MDGWKRMTRPAIFVGDIHAHVGLLDQLLTNTITGADIMLMGDLMVGFGSSGGRDVVLHNLSVVAEKTGNTIYFLRGNHERIDVVWNHIDRSTRKVHDLGKMGYPGVNYCDDGSVIELADRPFLVVGGAYSVDRLIRDKDVDWFENELTTADDIAFAAYVAGGYFNLDTQTTDLYGMLTHDIPSRSLDTCTNGRASMIPYFSTEEHILAANVYHKQLDDLLDIVNPRVLIHGHMHKRYTFNEYGEGPTIIGLSNLDGGNPTGAILLDKQLP